MNICDCTLRDGGYYTNWDFDQKTVNSYFTAMNQIPAIKTIEVGYRSKPMADYLGEYFYCPVYILKMARELCPDKNIAIMLNEKDTRVEDLGNLLDPCKKYVDLVRIAVDPKNFERALLLAHEIKKMGFNTAFNLMYMSTWVNDKGFIQKLKKVKGAVDIVYMVDSFGGVYPDDVKQALKNIKNEVDVTVGFHGHNNMELGLANSLTAIENGCDIVDATITGMGRGAGNLKTELLLTCLNSKNKIDIDFNKLNTIVAEFEVMQSQYQWGTNLPYMISGAFSLPQKEVMSWISKRRYTTESIINALQNRKNNLDDNHNIPPLKNEKPAREIIIIGGGPNGEKHSHGLAVYCNNNPDTVLIHAGSRYVDRFNSLQNRQYFCLLGAEGYKLEKSLPTLSLDNIKCVVEPSPRKMGTILPKEIMGITYELEQINFTSEFPDSLLTIAFQLSIELNAENVLLFGFDGYDMKTDSQMVEVSKENQLLLEKFIETGKTLISITPTNYQGINTISIYSNL